MVRVALIGWRGMVGSVLLQRMEAEGDWKLFEPVFFSTSQQGEPAPLAGAPPLADAYDLSQLERFDVILSCQGGSYTERTWSELRKKGWSGFWIDAASTLRMADDAMIVLDPVNGRRIEQAISAGCRDLIGGNCTVSLMLMALAPLLREGWVEWLSTMTYQAASGAGAAALRELCAQIRQLGAALAAPLEDPASELLELERAVAGALASGELPTGEMGAPLATSLIPWIDRRLEGGVTREEWKGYAESNKILGLDPPVPIDGLCVRIGALRCHSQAVTVKLRREVPLDEIEELLAGAHDWVRLVPNEPEETRKRLTPAAVSGSLEVPVGRLRKMRMGPDFLAAFTVGDQLLWGAAEPLRRALRLVSEHLEARPQRRRRLAMEAGS